MDDTYKEGYGGEQEAEQEAVKEGAMLFGGSKGANMAEKGRAERLAILASAGVGRFRIEEHMDVRSYT